MLIAKCEHCGAVEQVPDSYAGKTLECECGHDVVVPFPKPKTQAQPIVLFDPLPKEEHKDSAKEKKNEDERKLKLPTNNRLEWVAQLHYFFAGIFGFVSFVFVIFACEKDKPNLFYGFGIMLAWAVSCIIIGAIVQVFGAIELNTRKNTELLGAILNQIENKKGN